jgi:hypothetical protein
MRPIELNGAPDDVHAGTKPASRNTYGYPCQRVAPTGRPGGKVGAEVALQDVVWPYDPLKPLSWQFDSTNPTLKVGDYVRMYGGLVTDVPHSGEGPIAQFLCRMFSLGPACATEGVLHFDLPTTPEGFDVGDLGKCVNWDQSWLVGLWPGSS